jgi:hypothetical protein
MSFFASYVNNAGTKSDKDTAWLMGTRLNKAQVPGSWELLYNYRDVEADSVSPILDNSDFIGGGTAGRGHKFQAKYQIHKNVQAALTYYLAKRDRPAGNDLDHDILQADIIVKF